MLPAAFLLMAYILGPDSSHPNPALLRLDHLICRTPDIERFHRHFIDVLGFPEAWPIGRFWPEGRTSGVALGGINLEFIQSDSSAQGQAITDTVVFEPTSLETAEKNLGQLGVQTRRFDKIEPDRELLALRGFAGTRLETPQLICCNLLLESDFPVPMFLCEYTPFLRNRLTDIPSPHGKAVRITIQLGRPSEIGKLLDLGYLGSVELLQTKSLGEPKVVEISLGSGPLNLKGIDPGFRFT